MKHPAHHRRSRARSTGFTLIELAMVVAVAAVLAAVLLAAGRGSRLADGLTKSTANVRQILIATVMYHLDHAGQVPMRGCRYNNGQLSGWDAWNFGGKNCDQYWQSFTSGFFDESAYSRPLNAYLYPARIPRPTGYLNTGSGPTWTFAPGMPSFQQRVSLQADVYRSPGDTFTFESGVGPNYFRSTYDDIGTSYELNMAWWNDPSIPGSFTAKYDEGVRRIGFAFDGANPSFVWIGDKYIGQIPNTSTGFTGEFGKRNACVSGFADGTVRYLQLVSLAHQGPGYTLWP